MLFEFCAENFTCVPQALAAGAQRIELCDNLAVGGTSPSVGVINATLSYAHARGASVMCMARPRGGNFLYNDEELEMIETDAVLASSLGADGIVVGCLKEGADGLEVDQDALRHVVGQAQAVSPYPRIEVTFHMAFDELTADRQFASLECLAQCGVTRILTHGGRPDTSILENAAHIRRLRDAAPDIVVLPGGGISWKNWQQVADKTGAQELHGTKIVKL